VIVVVGRPEAKQTRAGVTAEGLAATIASAAAAAGRPVELVARIPDDPIGDRLLGALSAAGVGHVATLRQPAGDVTPVLEAADLELGLRYLSDVSVVVLTELVDPGLVSVATDAVAWNRGSLIAIVAAGAIVPPGFPSDATVFEGPDTDPDGAFAGLVGAYAAALDAGTDVATAFEATVAARPGWTPVVGD
jgi:hypothetical protein